MEPLDLCWYLTHHGALGCIEADLRQRTKLNISQTRLRDELLPQLQAVDPFDEAEAERLWSDTYDTVKRSARSKPDPNWPGLPGSVASPLASPVLAAHNAIHHRRRWDEPVCDLEGPEQYEFARDANAVEELRDVALDAAPHSIPGRVGVTLTLLADRDNEMRPSTSDYDDCFAMIAAVWDGAEYV